MSHPQYVKAAICEKYQTLLEECAKALTTWNRCRERVAQAGHAGEEEGDEIFRLQAKYARTYAALQNHLHDCVLCRLIARFEGSQNADVTLYGSTHH